MKKQNDEAERAATDVEQAASEEQQARRAAVAKLAKLAAAAPMAALLFNPKTARADGTGGGILD